MSSAHTTITTLNVQEDEGPEEQRNETIQFLEKSSENHYLKQELYDLVKKDSEIFEFLQSGSLDGIWYWDIEAPEQEWLSPRFKEVFGYEDHEVPNTSEWWQKNIFPEDLQLTLDNFEKHCKDPNYAYDQVVRYRHKHGSTVWIRCRGIAIRNKEGKPIRMLGAHSDVTALKEAEALVEKRAQELSRSNKELSEFVYVASHDLQEPLRMVSSYTALLSRKYEGQLDKKADKYIQYIVEGSNQMQLLINDLLRYAQVGQKSAPQNTIDPSEVLDDLVKDLEKSIQESQAEIHWDKLPEVVINRRYLTQIFQNLLGNAIKFRKKGVNPSIEIKAEKQKGHWVFSVSDNGIGMPLNSLERVFGVFQRLHGRGEFSGNGIGLSIVKKMIEISGGNIWIQSEIDKGTTFFFTVPA